MPYRQNIKQATLIPFNAPGDEGLVQTCIILHPIPAQAGGNVFSCLNTKLDALDLKNNGVFQYRNPVKSLPIQALVKKFS